MMHDLLFLLIPLVAFALNALLQIALLLWAQMHHLKTLVVSWVFGSFASVGLGLLVTLNIGEIVSNFCFFSILWYGYFHYVNIGEASLRIRILAELEESEAGLHRADLERLYNAQRIIESRIDRLTEDGQVELRDGKFVLGKSKFLPIAHFFSGLRWLIMGSGYKV